MSTDAPALRSPERDALGGLDFDELLAARTAFYGKPAEEAAPEASQRSADPPRDGLLAQLLAAEYGSRPQGVRRQGGAFTPGDLTTAALRRACRLGIAMPPRPLLHRALGHPRQAGTALELWPGSVSRYGPRQARDVLRQHLVDRRRSHPEHITVLLELAMSAGLRPLTAEEAAAAAAASPLRQARHALWRYLHLLPGGSSHLPDTATARDDYERLLLSPPADLAGVRMRPGGLIIAQSMLLGSLDRPGHGQSGGLSVLLAGLGDRLASTSAAAGVVTIVTASHRDLAEDPCLVRERAPGHWIVRLPVDAPAVPLQQQMPAHRAGLTWWAVRLLRLLPRPVDVMHVRYADDASLGLAEAGRILGCRLVFTATPDPHRHLARRHADTASGSTRSAEHLRQDLHRVFIADRLVHRAHSVVGIPGRGGTSELLRFFPELSTHNDGRGPSALPEGVPAYVPARHEDELRRTLLETLFAGGDDLRTLAPGDRNLTLLLCVGRLHTMKQQHLLVDAWLNGGLWRTTTLVLVGGATDHPTEEERNMRRRLHETVRVSPSAARRLALLPALANKDVRRLEHAIAESEELNAWYVCPSLKEEFGLAVLEAMEAGLPVAATRRGGIPHYLRDGVNGVLLDTSTRRTLVRGLHHIAALAEPERRRMAYAGRRTVLERFSVAEMAEVLAQEYVGVCLRPL
ncbi:glycosyltransferase family 4 protein [Streptomyces rubiginosohelvolus]|uniref:glycosyltransferase family 4 protein n=1 Tax=Streptomyces rubiginosohelvolus TaxID=67362 RepID=UPI00365496B6